jgi:hypothetical protein
VRQEQVAYVKVATAKMKSLLENINDKDVRKQVEKVYDVINSSPVKSHPSLSQIENDILVAVGELDEVVSCGDKERIVTFAKSLVKMVDERNVKLKVLN